MAAKWSRNVLRFLFHSQPPSSFSKLKHGVYHRNYLGFWTRLLYQNHAFTTNATSIISHSLSLKGSITNGTFKHSPSKAILAPTSTNYIIQRGVTLVSKKGKRKTCKAVAKRFIRTGKGKLKRWRCGYHHNQTKKSGRRKRFLRKPTYASKTQLKTLNKMLNGW